MAMASQYKHYGNSVSFGDCDANMVADGLVLDEDRYYLRINVTETKDLTAQMGELEGVYSNLLEKLKTEHGDVEVVCPYGITKPHHIFVCVDSDDIDFNNYGAPTVCLDDSATVEINESRGASLEQLEVVWGSEFIPAENRCYVELHVISAVNYCS